MSNTILIRDSLQSGGEMQQQNVLTSSTKAAAPKAAAAPKVTTKHEIEIVEIDGIPYYIDALHNVYQHERIHEINPPVVAHWRYLEDGRRRLSFSD
jgi:hypothetical protein